MMKKDRRLIGFMRKNLEKRGWVFYFRVHCISPSGFRYEASGKTSEEAIFAMFSIPYVKGAEKKNG